VVLIDIWGTWCKPCREAIPGLIQLYRKSRRRGLEIVGIAYEPNAPDPPTAVQMVRRFVQEAGIPYRCVMGELALLEKIPNFHGFPTSMLIDRAGKVRLVITENTGETIDALADAAQILLAEPATPPAGTDKAPKPK
jgi:thiol-disulfide isomerase/thioredoxin